jgi:uncharacterized protein
MKAFISNHLVLLLMAIILAFSPLFFWHSTHQQTTKVLIAAGQKSSQSYAIAKAIAKVVKDDFPELPIELIETRGAKQNATLIEKGLVQLATVQAEKLVGTNARLVANLYPDTYQILVSPKSNIFKFEDLKGKKVAMQTKGSGENDAFWTIAKYFDLNEDDIHVYSGSDRTADWIFKNGQVDAVFKVRSPGDKTITEIVKNTNARFINIDQAEALKLKYPSRETIVIPKGTYSGSPAIPDVDVYSIAENQLLIARNDVEASIVEKFTGVLFDKRQDLTNLEPLAGLIQQPKEHGEQLIPIHDGVRNFWDREKPSFLKENSDAIATIISLGAIFGSILMKYFSNKRKLIMHTYNRRLMDMALHVKDITTRDALQFQAKRFDDFMLELLEATENGLISAEDYTTLSFSFEVVNSSFAERRSVLLGGGYAN